MRLPPVLGQYCRREVSSPRKTYESGMRGRRAGPRRGARTTTRPPSEGVSEAEVRLAAFLAEAHVQPNRPDRRDDAETGADPYVRLEALVGGLDREARHHCLKRPSIGAADIDETHRRQAVIDPPAILGVAQQQRLATPSVRLVSAERVRPAHGE